MQKISFFSLVLLIIAAIDSIRNLPASAVFGSQLIFFFVLSALIFLIPVALVSAELAGKDHDKGGVYHWVYKAFGAKSAMLAIWLQWINTLVWYPTILSFIAGTIAYLIQPELAQNPWYLSICIFVIFWTVTLMNLKGLSFTVRVNSFCAFFGTIIPMVFLIGLGLFWVFSGQPLHIHLDKASLWPTLKSQNNWMSLIAIMASFLGMELSGVHVNDIKDPRKNFPRAVLLSSLIILLSMMMGSLSIAFVLPAEEISLVAGVMQVFDNFFTLFHIQALTPLLALMIVVGSMGGIINWILSPAKGLMHAAEFKFLPSFFVKKNRHGVPSRILLAQALIVSLFCFLFLFVPSVNAFYWFLTALSTELYMIMYILIFAAALKLRKARLIGGEKAFEIPSKFGMKWLVAGLGLMGCLATILVSFIPPEAIHVKSAWQYGVSIGLGNVLTIAPVFLFFRNRKKFFITS